MCFMGQKLILDILNLVISLIKKKNPKKQTSGVQRELRIAENR